MAQQEFYTILTTAGLAYEANRKALGLPIKLTQMSVGDGNGAVYNPDATQTTLRREVWRGPINALLQDANNPTWLVGELTLPDDVGGWVVREVGFWTDSGILYAVGKYPESLKPLLAEGAGKEFYIRAIFQTSNAASVVLVVDDNVVKATRAFVIDHVAAELAKLDGKRSVRAATTGPIVLSGAQLIDTVAVIAGDRVLVKDQADQKTNGIYVVANGAWVRAADADASVEVTPGLFVPVEEGAANGDSVWQLITNAPITLGETALQFSAVVGSTGISAGTYRSVTVDKTGRVIAGTNPTTLAGYGITDALRLEDLPISTDGIVGAFASLKASATGANSTVTVTADSVCVKNAAGEQKALNGVALAINSAAVGVNGLDSGALASSAWYSVWVIYSPTTQAIAGLLSLSATAPTLPAGYTHKARVGWIRTDATANKYPLSFIQFGRRAQYRVAAGSNVPSLPVMAGGVQGNPVHIPVFVAVGVAGVVPPTAGRISLTMYGYIANTSVIVAPSASHYGVTSTAGLASPLHISQGSGTGATHASVTGEFALESSNIFYASSAPATGVACLGWEDNL